MTVYCGSYAKPRSIKSIRTISDNVRSAFGYGHDFLCPIDMLEKKLPMLDEDFVFHVVPNKDLKVEAFCNPNSSDIVLREKTYKGLRDGNPRDRFTVLHEVGHLILHRGDNIMMARGTEEIRAFENPEWQADTFAAEILMPYEIASKITSVEVMMNTFGVSMIAAERRIKKLNPQN